MFFWFAGLSFLLVAWVFASPAIDYRLVIGGAVLPVVEMIVGGPWALHTLLAPVTVMTAVMLVFRGRRLVQRKWLGISIGLFVNLVLDGAWVRTTLFWWPLFGWRADAGDIPGWEAVPIIIGMEVIGLVALGWMVRRYRLDRSAERALFITEGRLSRELMNEPPGTC